jgi:hypothetical protein
MARLLVSEGRVLWYSPNLISESTPDISRLFHAMRRVSQENMDACQGLVDPHGDPRFMDEALYPGSGSLDRDEIIPSPLGSFSFPRKRTRRRHQVMTVLGIPLIRSQDPCSTTKSAVLMR